MDLVYLCGFSLILARNLFKDLFKISKLFLNLR